MNPITHFLSAVKHSPSKLVGAACAASCDKGRLVTDSAEGSGETNCPGEDACISGRSTPLPSEEIERCTAPGSNQEKDVIVGGSCQPTSGVHYELARNDAEMAVECTPKFGPMASRNFGGSTTDLFLDGAEAGEGERSLYDSKGENGSLKGALADKEQQSHTCPIACSPVELQEKSARSSEPGWSSGTQTASELGGNLPGPCGSPSGSMQVPKGAKLGAESLENPALADETAVRVDPSCSTLEAASCSQRRLPGRLETLWQRNGSSPGKQSSQKLRTETGSWPIYRQEDISEEVLSELPNEIQEELRIAFRPKSKQSNTKRGTITDFFKRTSTS